MRFTQEWFRNSPQEEVKLLNGEEVWVCDYRFTSLGNKPIRVIVPTLCIIHVSFYVDKYYPRGNPIPVVELKIKKNGKDLKVEDNTTAYNNWLKIFNDEQECRAFFREQMTENLDDLDEWEKGQIERAAELRATMHKLLKEHG